jgi:hypothetical protein
VRPYRYSAAKFGVEYREPEQRRDLRHVVRKEKALERAAARPTFNPGLDLFSEVHCQETATTCWRFRVMPDLCRSNHVQACGQYCDSVAGSGCWCAASFALQEEIQRRRDRAARFQTEDSLAAYQPAVDPADIAKRKKRAERFGTEFQTEDAAGLMDVGA